MNLFKIVAKNMRQRALATWLTARRWRWVWRWRWRFC